MRILFRADAGALQGSGHVMRCLTLADELRRRGHDVAVAGTVEGIPWLREFLATSGVPVVPAERDALDPTAALGWGPDVVVVDSYRIPEAQVSSLAAVRPVLAIVDGTTRGIEAPLYLDQNLGAEDRPWQIPAGSRVLAGARYAMIRRPILKVRRPEPWRIIGRPRILAVMGGTDATGAIVGVAGGLARLGSRADVTVIAGEEHRAAVERRLAGMPSASVIPPTPDLAALMSTADVLVSAAGTSSWEVCTLGIPAVMVAVVDNQSEGLREIVERGLGVGIDASRDPEALAGIGPALARLLDDSERRRRYSERCREVFDGRGVGRVADAVELLARPHA